MYKLALIKHKNIKIITCILMACALLFTIFITYIPNNSSSKDNATNTIAEYSNLLFDKNAVSKININISEDDWQDMLNNPLNEEYHQADITINDETIYNVGIRTKGNTSLSQVASSDSDRYSFKIKFDKYVNDQNYHGLDMLNLNNIYADATYLKEYLSYDLFKFMGVATPENSFSNISINNNNIGLYLAIEGLQNSYLQRNFGDSYGNLYKAEGTGTNLKWTGDSQDNYCGLKNNSVTKITDDDFQKVVDMIYNLNQGTNLDNYLDVDSILKYFAVSTALVNLDSYQSNLFHNYYIYEENGICTILPWDLNLAFGGFPVGMGGRQDKNNQESPNVESSLDSATSTIHFPIDEPTSANLSDSPLLAKLLEIDNYKDIYHRYLNDIVTNYFNSEIFKSKLYDTASLIDSYVKNDPTTFFSYDQFKNSLNELYKLGTYRAKSIAMQLSGSIPSTKTTQANVNLNEYFGSNLVNMTLLGSMNGGKGDHQNKFEKFDLNNTDNKEMVQMPPNNNSPLPNIDNNINNTPPDLNRKPPDNNSQGDDNSNSNRPSKNDNTAPNMGEKPINKDEFTSNRNFSYGNIFITLISLATIIISIIIIIKFKRKKYTS